MTSGAYGENLPNPVKSFLPDRIRAELPCRTLSATNRFSFASRAAVELAHAASANRPGDFARAEARARDQHHAHLVCHLPKAYK